MVVEYEPRDAAAVVAMNRPEYRNAQNPAMASALDEAFHRAPEAHEDEVVVLAGTGRSLPRRAGLWTTMARAHNKDKGEDSPAGQDAKSMKAASNGS